MIFLRVTIPIRNKKFIEKAMKTFLKLKNYDSLCSVIKLNSYPQKFVKISNNCLKSLYDDKSIDLSTDIMESGESYEIDTAIKAIQFDLNYDGDNFNYLSSYDLNKTRLGGDDSGYSVNISKIGSNKLRVIVVPSINSGPFPQEMANY